MTKYEVWHVPRPGKESNWNRERRIAGPFVDRDDAEYESYMRWVDEPAPDKGDYYYHEIRKVEV